MREMNGSASGWRDNFLGKCRTLAMNTVKRRVILHYHLFKNAGSSVDHILASNFGGRWQTLEGENPWSMVGPTEIATYIRQNRRVLAVSSHHFRLPLPEMPDAALYPIFFLRHPIDRIDSVHKFQKKQGAGWTAKSRQAIQGGLREYIEWLREDTTNEGNVVRNCQTIFLTDAQSKWPDSNLPLRANTTHLSTAKEFLRALLVFGLVEHFDESASRFGKWLNLPFPGINFFPARLNTQSEREAPLDERLTRIEKKLGPALYQDLLNMNQYDMELYHFACQLFDQRSPLERL